MGIREKEVEVDWDVCAQIFQKRFLLTEIKQKMFAKLIIMNISCSLYLHLWLLEVV